MTALATLLLLPRPTAEQPPASAPTHPTIELPPTKRGTPLKLLAIVSAELTGARYDATAEDETRILEIIELVPDEMGAPLANQLLDEAWKQEDQATIALW